MNISNLLKIALRAIAANKMRSFLTALGIIIGIASVITMLAAGQGTKNSIQSNISEMGSNMIMISPGADMRGGVRQDASSMETLKLTDYPPRPEFRPVYLWQQQHAVEYLRCQPRLPGDSSAVRRRG